MRKLLLITLALAVSLSIVPCAAETQQNTGLTGNFFTSMWDASEGDLDVQELLHGYKLTEYVRETDAYEWNDTVVKDVAIHDDAKGNRTYTITLQDGLRYSDGARITAWDYAFTFLLMTSGAVRETGGNPTGADWILGGQDYANGSRARLRGLRVLDDLKFAVTARVNIYPYRASLYRFSVSPYPYREIVPDHEIMDSSIGAYIVPEIDADTLDYTIFDPATGYMTHPTVVSGPYCLQEYADGKATLIRNEYYIGSTGEQMIEINPS